MTTTPQSSAIVPSTSAQSTSVPPPANTPSGIAADYPLRPTTPNGTKIPDSILSKTPNTLRSDLAKLQIDLIRQRGETHFLENTINSVKSSAAGRNAVRAARRQGGEQGVSADEDEGMSGLVRELTSSVIQQIRTSGQGDGTAGANTAPGGLDRRITVSDLQPTAGPDRYTAPDGIRALFKHKVHIPIHAFTAILTARFARLEFTPSIPIICDSGATRKVIDTKAFGPEEDITVGQWLEGWRNFIIFLGERLEAPILESVVKYQNALLLRPEFHECFKAILKFDIKRRQRWIAAPFMLGDNIDYQDLASLKVEVSFQEERALREREQRDREQRERDRNTQHSNGALADRTTRTNHRSQPYPAYTQNSQQEQSQSQQQQSNSNGRSFRNAGTNICIRCGGPDHRAQACDSRTTIRGNATLTFWDHSSRSLVEARQGGQRICSRFNAGTCTITDASHGAHKCSLCGLGDHGAASGRCTGGAGARGNAV